MNGISPKQWVKIHFIWIGFLAVDSPRKIKMKRYSDGRMNTTPPRLNRLHFRWQSFRKLMDPFVWNYVLDNGLEEVEEVEDVCVCVSWSPIKGVCKACNPNR